MKRLFIVIAVAIVLGLMVSPGLAATPEQIENSIDLGLKWLADEQQTDGSWSDYGPGSTGIVLLKFEDRAKELGKDPLGSDYEYSANIAGGLNYLFSVMSVSGDQISIYNANYYTSIALLAITASNNPSTVVNVPGSPVHGMTYTQVAQGLLNWVIAAQPNSGCAEGGWGYSTAEPTWADQSNAGYSVLALTQAQAIPPDGFGFVIPASTKTELLVFLGNVQVASGGSIYTPCWGEESGWVNILKTGSLIQEHAFAGTPATDPAVVAAIAYIEDHWNDLGPQPGFTSTSLGWKDSYQAMFCMMKGLESYNIVLLDTDNDGNVDDNWFDEVSSLIIANQDLSDGSFKWINPAISEGEDSPELRTAWALLTLEKFVPSPDLLIVTKTADAASYCLGDTINFTVTVNNPNQYEATNLVWNDASPSQITIFGSDPDPLPTSIPALTKITVYLLATADTVGSGLTNQVTVSGLVNGQSVDGTGTTTSTFTIEQCNEPPDTSNASADASCLWPPNNKLVDIAINGVTDPDEGDKVTISITGVTSDEATANAPGAGGVKFAPDAFIIKKAGTDDKVQLRAERSGTSDGRVYVISFTATDDKGAESTGSVTVKVPHDQSKPNKPCQAVDSGQMFDATAIN